jgi:hypothetical protein
MEILVCLLHCKYNSSGKFLHIKEGAKRNLTGSSADLMHQPHVIVDNSDAVKKNELV